ncbi:MAG TPA: hypothetical protein VKB80_18800 [Kofleriaceae bacterium]|nr:hypothetical protein [Kofleriaceae bacterium]
MRRARHGAAIAVGLALALAGTARAQPGSRGPGTGPAAPGSGQAGPGTTTPIPPSLLDAEPPTVSAAASSKDVVLGATFYLFVRVVYQPGVQVNLPASLQLGGAFEESARTDSTHVNADGTITRDFEVALLAFEVGDLVIPPIPVTYAAHGRAHEVVTDPVPVQVKSFIGDGENKLRDIAGPVALERRDLTLVYVGGGALATLLVALVLYLVRRAWHRRRRAVLARLPEAVQRSAHEDALARLDDLEASGALDAGDLKPVYLAMSEILREYIGRRFGFPALDLTTFEIRRELTTRPGGPAAADLVSGWLERADLVKFAGYEASADEARQALYDARIFIDRTLPGGEAAGAAAAPPPMSAEGAA